MAEKSRYNYRVEPQDVDFTLRATIPSLGGSILNTAGIDAHGKGFGVDALLWTGILTLSDAAGNEFGRAVTQWAMIDLQSRSAIDLSWVGDAHADAIVDAAPPTDKPRKIRAVSPTATAEHRVVYSDIDFNRHVNTMRYIEMMLDMLPVDMLTQEAPVRLDIHFLKECRFGQTLTVGCELRGRSALFEISADGAAAAVRASIEWK